MTAKDEGHGTTHREAMYRSMEKPAIVRRWSGRLNHVNRSDRGYYVASWIIGSLSIVFIVAVICAQVWIAGHK